MCLRARLSRGTYRGEQKYNSSAILDTQGWGQGDRDLGSTSKVRSSLSGTRDMFWHATGGGN